MIAKLLDLGKYWTTYREVVTTLVVYDIKARYKQSLFGAAWAVLQPFTQMVVFTVLFSKFAKIDTGDVPYPIFCYSGMVFWTFFSTSLTKATLSLVANASLIRKVYLPREIFCIVAILSSFFDFATAYVVLLGMMLFYGVVPGVGMLMVVPLLLLQMVFTLGVSLLTSMLHARYRDVGNAIGLVVQMWMFACPVAYPLDVVPERFRTLYLLNPMAFLIDAFRRIVLKQGWPDPRPAVLSLVIILVAFLACFAYFKRQEDNIADII